MNEPPLDALLQLKSAVKRSQRSSSVSLPIGFARRPVTDASAPMLAQLMRGGRGGEVRLKLYLSLNMLATSEPKTIKRTYNASTFARMLNLEDEYGAGARRVREAMAWLESANLILRAKPTEDAPALTLLDPVGTGTEWSRGGSRYITIPIQMWSRGWLIALSARAVAVYIALREATGGKPEGNWLTGERKAEYDFSDETWARASRELVHKGLLEVESVFAGDDFEDRRRRLRYRLLPGAMESPPADWPIV